MKKIRGWKSKLRRLQNWKEEHIDFDLEFLRVNHVDYIKLFNNLEVEKIPSWYKKEICVVLTEVLASWKEQANLNLNHYYMRLHISEDNIFDSQIMITIEDQMKEYKERFIKCEDAVNSPIWLKELPFRLEPYYSCSIWLEEELNSLETEEKNSLFKNLIEIKKVPSYDGEIYNEYVIREGTLWCFDIER
ncbi:hypothetical protein DOE78_23385 [Bacillus sp. Y1]|nr:hypothetical protein [Bacillus sp. Y1]AYA78104.1 hypothetical protein DOE78_23385 [Bacillus sp. Y1]